MKLILDVEAEMSALYDAVRAGTVDLETARELSNIAGRYLRAVQLKLAREAFAADNEKLRFAREVVAKNGLPALAGLPPFTKHEGNS